MTATKLILIDVRTRQELFVTDEEFARIRERGDLRFYEIGGRVEQGLTPPPPKSVTEELDKNKKQ